MYQGVITYRYPCQSIEFQAKRKVTFKILFFKLVYLQINFSNNEIYSQEKNNNNGSTTLNYALTAAKQS